MKIFLVGLLFLINCAHSQSDLIEQSDAGTNDASDSMVLDARSRCPAYQCGITIIGSDIVDCGQCEAYNGTVCGDNFTPGICGDTCQPQDRTVACDYWIGYYQKGNFVGKKYDGQFNGKQYLGDCADPSVIISGKCMQVYMDPNKPCTQCGYFWCCHN